MTRPPTTLNFLLIGAGGHARVVADAARASGMRIIGVLDDDLERTIEGIAAPNLGQASDPPSEVLAYAAHAATGDATRRRRGWPSRARGRRRGCIA